MVVLHLLYNTTRFMGPLDLHPSSGTVIGIHSQPYRNYLTERNHFYHSASQPTTFNSTRPTSTLISSIQTSSSQQASSPVSETPLQSKQQKSLLGSFGIQQNSFSKSDSKQSLNSQSSAANNHKMASANNKQHRSNSAAVTTKHSF